MDAEQMRQFSHEIRGPLLEGRMVVRNNVSVEPSPEGNGYLIHARGQTWHRRELHDALRVFIQELGNNT